LDTGIKLCGREEAPFQKSYGVNKPGLKMAIEIVDFPNKHGDIP